MTQTNEPPINPGRFIKIAVTVHSREWRLGAEVYIWHDQAKEMFQKLLVQRAAIESELGFALDWQELPDKNACRIAVFRPDFDLADEAAWPSCYAWLVDKAQRLSDAFRPRVKLP